MYDDNLNTTYTIAAQRANTSFYNFVSMLYMNEIDRFPRKDMEPANINRN